MTPNPLHINGVDMFCGAGGTSTGLLDAVNQRADETNQAHRITLVAINHWEIAIETHKLNHPTVRHIQDDLERIDAREVIPGGHLRLLVASPECVHFSNARGGEPMNWQSRATSKYVYAGRPSLKRAGIMRFGVTPPASGTAGTLNLSARCRRCLTTCRRKS